MVSFTLFPSAKWIIPIGIIFSTLSMYFILNNTLVMLRHQAVLKTCRHSLSDACQIVTSSKTTLYYRVSASLRWGIFIVIWWMTKYFILLPVRLVVILIGCIVLFAWLHALRCHIYQITGRSHLLTPKPMPPFPLLSSRSMLQHPKMIKRSSQLREKQSQPYQPSSSSLPASPRIQIVLKELIQRINRDFVRSWYEGYISPERPFLTSVDAALYTIADRWTKRVENIDFISFITTRIVPLLTRHVADYRKAERMLKHSRLSAAGGALKEASSPSSSQTDTEILRLARFYHDGQLHPAIKIQSSDPFTTVGSERDYLAPKIQKILPLLLPTSEASSKCLVILLREILSSWMLIPLVSALSDSDYWNGTMEWLSDMALSEETSLVEKIKDSILGRGGDLHSKGEYDEASTAYLSRPISFEEFMASIKECQSHQEAQALRNIITSEIQRKAAGIENCEGDEFVNGVKVSHTKSYISQLQTALRRIDKKIKSLQKKAFRQRSASAIDLEDITSSPHLFAQFTEFMDSRNRLPFLQFYSIAGVFFRAPSPRGNSPDIDTLRRFWRDYLSQDATYYLHLKAHSLGLYAEELDGTADIMDSSTIAKMTACLEGCWKEVEEILCLVDVPAFYNSLRQESSINITPVKQSPAKETGILKRLPTVILVDGLDADGEESDASSNDEFSARNESPRPKSNLSSLLISRIGSPFKLKKEGAKKELQAISSTSVSEPAWDKSFAKSSDLLPQHSVLDSTTASDPSLLSVGNDPEILLSHRAILPSFITLPKVIQGYNEEIDRLIAEFREINEQLRGIKPENARGLNLMKVGIEVELKELIDEKRALELQEFQRLISPQHMNVSIVGASVHQEDMRNYVAFEIKVLYENADGEKSEWLITRRFSDFYALHSALKPRFSFVNDIDFPSKTLNGLLKPRKEFVESRRIALDAYLKELIKHPEIYGFGAFVKFICNESLYQVLAELYQSTNDTGSTNEKKFHLNSAFFKGLFHLDGRSDYSRSSAGFAAIRQLLPEKPDSLGVGNPNNSKGTPSMSSPPVSPIKKRRKESNDFCAGFPVGMQSLSEPEDFATTTATEAIIADLFVELFELKEKSNWFRRQAVYIFVQQLFGGAVERKVTENLRWVFGHENIAFCLEYFRDRYWPNDAPFNATNIAPRTEEEKRRCKEVSQGKLLALFPELFGSLVGRQNAKRGAVRLWLLFQNRRLNQQLLYLILDELISVIFPEA